MKEPHATLAGFLAIAMFIPVLLNVAGPLWGLPAWLAGAIGSGALFGALIVFWRAGALRARYILLFVVALAAAAVVGSLNL
jgi:hypothetical protein